MERLANDPGNMQSGEPSMSAKMEDEYIQRGRKRRRTSVAIDTHVPAHKPSGESTTLRGRGRRRSTSDISSQSGSLSIARNRSMSPPGRKYQKKAPKLEVAPKKRSQSPSRSRSRNDTGTPQRRRQRTASRSRNHGVEKGNANGPGQAGSNSKEGIHDHETLKKEIKSDGEKIIQRAT